MKSTLGINKKLRRLFIQLFLISAVCISSLTALDPGKTINQYVHNNWVRQKGLPAHSINIATQTRDGYLWLVNSSGLFKFDGVGFTEVGTNPNNKNSHETITTLCETQDGSLWIGTASDGR